MKKRTQGKGGQGKKKKHFQSHKGGRKGAADEAETEDAATKSQVGGHGKNEAPLQVRERAFATSPTKSLREEKPNISLFSLLVYRLDDQRDFRAQNGVCTRAR